MQYLPGLALACWLVASCVEAGADTDVGARTEPSAVVSQVVTARPVVAPSASAVQPKRPSIAEALAAIPEDPPPKKIILETHYFVSNEPKPEAFRLRAEGLGGIYVGVGAEQNYLFAGWARPRALVLVDFDQWVVDVHFIHGVLLRDAPDPEAFVARWSRQKSDQTRALLAAAAPDRETRERILEIHGITRSGVYEKLLNQQVGFRGRGIATWLTDRAQYEHLAGLFRKGHARALRGDFTGRRTLEGIAHAARELDIPVRAVYLSNVEDYFHYSSGLGKNLLAQPIDDRSLLFRTMSVRGTDYVYLTQRMSDFRGWLAVPGVDHRIDMLAATSIRHGPEGHYVGGPP